MKAKPYLPSETERNRDENLDAQPSSPKLPSTMTRDEARQFLSGVPDIDAAKMEEALQDPVGIIQFNLPGVGLITLIPKVNEYEVHVAEFAKTAISKESKMKSTQPMLIIGPRIERDPNTPRRPAKALTEMEQILAKSGTILTRSTRGPFDPNDPADVAALVPEGYRMIETPEVPLRRYIGATANEAIAKACSSHPEFGAVESSPRVLIATKAEPVERPKIEGTISKDGYRESIASSEAQAQEVQDRIRARQASENSMPAQRSDGSFYGADGKTPHEPLSMSRRPYDRDAAPGVGPVKIRKSELRPVEQKLIEGVERRVCEVNFCTEVIYSRTRRRCAAHAHSDRGKGLKG